MGELLEWKEERAVRVPHMSQWYAALTNLYWLAQHSTEPTSARRFPPPQPATREENQPKQAEIETEMVERRDMQQLGIQDTATCHPVYPDHA